MTLAIALAGVAGFVDALGFRHLDGLFVSFMSGNSTLLGVGLAAGDLDRVVESGRLVALFVAGAALGALADRLSGPGVRRAAVLTCESLLLALAATLHHLGHDPAAVPALVLAMGSANAVFQRQGTVSMGLTYVTGTLVKVGQGLVAALFGDGPLVWLPQVLLWLGLLGGAVIGVFCDRRFGLDAAWGAAGATAAATLVVALDVAGLRRSR